MADPRDKLTAEFFDAGRQIGIAFGRIVDDKFEGCVMRVDTPPDILRKLGLFKVVESVDG